MMTMKPSPVCLILRAIVMASIMWGVLLPVFAPLVIMKLRYGC